MRHIKESPMNIQPTRSLAPILTLVLLLLALPARADNLGAIGQGLAILFFAALIVLALMIVFIVLAVLLARRVKRRTGGKVLIPLSRTLAVLWYLAAFTPLVYGFAIGGHEHEWNLLFGVLGGLPVHVPSIIALVQASRLARIRREAPASGTVDRG
jgi:hypothetical protein